MVTETDRRTSHQLVLPDGSRTIVKQGEIVVQRGTDHQWDNASKTEWAREWLDVALLVSSELLLIFSRPTSTGMMYVLLPSKPVMIDGKALPDKSIH